MRESEGMVVLGEAGVHDWHRLMLISSTYKNEQGGGSDVYEVVLRESP